MPQHHEVFAASLAACEGAMPFVEILARNRKALDRLPEAESPRLQAAVSVYRVLAAERLVPVVAVDKVTISNVMQQAALLSTVVARAEADVSVSRDFAQPAYSRVLPRKL